MTKKHFIALADAIREQNKIGTTPFNDEQISQLAWFCQMQNSNFNKDRWLGYIAGTVGKRGGERRVTIPIKKTKNATHPHHDWRIISAGITTRTLQTQTDKGNNEKQTKTLLEKAKSAAIRKTKPITDEEINLAL